MERKILAFVLFTICITTSTFAQNGFQKAYGGSNSDIGLGAKPTTNGGYIITGYTQSYGSGGQDFYVIRTDASGDTVWTRTYGNSGSDAARSVQQTSDGGFIIAGATTSFGAGGFDFWLIKTDSLGAPVWNRTYGGTGNDVGYYVQQTSDGGYVVTGYTSSFGADFTDIYVVKTKPNGDTLWTRTYGGIGDDYPNYIEQTPNDGGYIIAGYTSSFGAGVYDVMLLKITSVGDLLWVNTYGGGYEDKGNAVRQTNDGGYIVVGYTYSFGAGGQDVYLIKTDSAGGVTWSKAYGGSGDDIGADVIQSADGNYVVAGWTYSFAVGVSDVYLLKADTGGTVLWSKDYGASNYDYGYSLDETADGGLLIGGYSRSFGAGDYDFALIKTNANGDLGCNVYTANTISDTAGTFFSTRTSLVNHYGGINASRNLIEYGGAVVTTVCNTAGIDETSVNHVLTVYPNPSDGNFHIMLKDAFKSATVKVFNAIGEEIYNKNLTPRTTSPEGEGAWGEVSFTTLSGIYLIRVIAGEKQYSAKIVIR